MPSGVGGGLRREKRKQVLDALNQAFIEHFRRFARVSVHEHEHNRGDGIFCRDQNRGAVRRWVVTVDDYFTGCECARGVPFVLVYAVTLSARPTFLRIS